MSERRGLVYVSVAAVLFSVGGLGVKLIPWKGLSIASFRSLPAGPPAAERRVSAVLFFS